MHRYGLLMAGTFLLLFFAVAAHFNMVQAANKPLDAPRAAGQVGERYDGYAIVRGDQPADIVTLVKTTNAERKAHYAKEAKEEGAPVEAVGKIYAAQIKKSAPAGTWFQSESGAWTQ